MIIIDNPSKCCGCTACASICAHNAITMEPDALGFLYPSVDKEKCIDCGLCEKVCQFNENYDCSLNLLQPKAYAARHKDMNEVMRSRSGAAFVAISDFIIDQGGIIYGAGYKDHFRVAHKRATTKTERDEFRGSKYVQSDLTGVFRQVRKDLKDGLTVLFSGTPCQTSGLNAFVGPKLRQNLVLLDIVCHGVPGPFIWRDYIAYLEKKQGDTVSVINFRDKELFGWAAHHESFIFKGGNGKKKTFSFEFYKSLFFRYSCGVCHFTNLRRPSDITIADFWSWQDAVPSMNEDNNGINLILTNTSKGGQLLQAVKEELTIVEVPIAKVIQPQLIAPVTLDEERHSFENYYKRNGFEASLNKYWSTRLRFRIARVIKRKFIIFTNAIHRLKNL